MAIDLVKSWVKYDDNLLDSSLTNVDDQNREVLYRIKNRLITSCGVTVVSSSDSVTSSASDNWSDYTDVVFATAGNAHSWIVLSFSSIETNYQLCIDCSETSTTTEQFSVYLSVSSGFTGGSITARPTATDEITVVNSSGWGVPNAADTLAAKRAWSVICSSDNSSVFVLFHYSNQPYGIWLLSKASNTPSGHSTDGIALIRGGSISSIPTVSILRNAANISCSVDGQSSPMYVTSSYANVDILSTSYFNRFGIDSSNQILMFGHSLVSSNVSRSGSYGYVPDLYWVNPSHVDYLHIYQSNGTSVGWVIFGDMAIPTPSIVSR